MMRARPAWALAVAFLVLTLGTGAAAAVPAPSTQPGPDVQISDVKSQPGTLQFVLSVGNLPSGQVLNPASVDVTVNGTSLAATAAADSSPAQQQAVPVREVIVALDTSGSMQGDGIAGAKQAALQYAKALPPDVLVGLLTFSDTPHMLVQPTADRAVFEKALASVSAAGDTSLYDAIGAACDAMKGLPSSAVRRMLILSDGDDTVSKKTEADAVAALKAQNIAADVVAFRLPGNQAVLTNIASASGGRVLPAATAADLGKAFSTAAQAFRQQVLVTVQVPSTLANSDVTVNVTANAGGSTFTAESEVHLLGAADTGPVVPDAVSSPVGTVSTVGAWLVAAICFVAILVVALLALYAPVFNHARAARAARLNEVGRYRVLGVVGNESWVAPPVTAPHDSQTAVTRGALSLVDRTVRARGKREKLVSELDRAGLRMRPEEWAVIQLLAVVVPAVLLAVLTGIAGFILGALAGWIGVRIFIRTKIRKRVDAFANQLPETLQLLAGSLRTGFSLDQALTSVVREGTEPSSSEFARALAEARLGADLEAALDNVADRMESQDLSWIVMAIRISREVGGSLAEVLSNTVVTMRQRVELRGLVRVLSAEGRMSAKVLIGLPIFMAAFLTLFRRNYIMPMFHSGGGVAMLIVGAVLLVLGALWLSRLTKIEV